MKQSIFLSRMLPVALVFGTAWAARGQFGHEYGATWAAAIGILAAIVFSGREDWYKRLPAITALAAIAWGAGGMISYGMLVGYSHAPDLLNTGYGMLMLTIAGGLYGYMGGGVLGLALESTPVRKVDWASLFTQMIAGGYLCWGVLIHQLEWLMTPPRSELWAGCLGASLALGWYMYRHGYHRALRTAWYSALGGGFGFGLGVFLQRLGHASGITFNWWNVMEYSTGFFSGLGLSYALYSRSYWPKTVTPHRTSNIIGWVFLVVLLPVLNLLEAVQFEKLVKQGIALNMERPESFAFAWRSITCVLSLILSVILTIYFRPARQQPSRTQVNWLILIYLTWYIVLSNILSATWLHHKFDSQHLYWVNLVVIAIMLFKSKTFSGITDDNVPVRPWTAHLLKWWGIALLILLLAACYAVTLNYQHGGARLRFE